MKRNVIVAALLAGLCFALSAVTLSLSGCGTVAKALNIVNPTYSLRGVVPHVAIALPLSASTIDFDFLVGVDNPNSVGLRLDRVDFDVLVNDNPIINSVRADQGVNIPARGVGDVHLRTRVGYQNIQSIFRQVADMVQGNRAHYTVRGSAYYNTPIGAMRFPVTLYSR
jgi:LEA14-like dessication related protein